MGDVPASSLVSPAGGWGGASRGSQDSRPATWLLFEIASPLGCPCFLGVRFSTLPTKLAILTALLPHSGSQGGTTSRTNRALG